MWIQVVENTKAHLLNTKLRNRTLWYDGTTSFDPQKLSKYVRMYDVEYVDYINDDVKEYNKNVSREQEIKVKTQCSDFDYSWNIPEEYRSMDVVSYISDQHLKLTANMDDDECDARDVRLAQELRIYKKQGLFNILRTIIYIINKLVETDTVWGVGRGSSVSSYVLYVIGVHDVDSYAYDLDIKDFINE